MTGTLRWPRFTIVCNDGKIFLWARSPVAPKKTSASDWDAFMVNSLLPGLFYVAAELETHRREQLVLMLYSMMYTLKFPAESFLTTILVSFSYILSTLPLPYGDKSWDRRPYAATLAADHGVLRRVHPLSQL